MKRLTKQEKKKIRYESKKEKRKLQKKKYDLKRKQDRAEMLSNMTEEERKVFIDNEKHENELFRAEQLRASLEGIPILIDLSYSDFMNEMEHSSLITQITQSIGFLKKCKNQHVRLVCINVSENMKARLETRGCKK